MSTFEELQDFFADAIPKSRALFRGAELEVFRMGGNMALAWILGMWLTAIIRKAGRQDATAGLHVRVHFRCPSPTRIYATQRATAREKCDSFADAFFWSPAFDQAVKSLVTPDLEAAILQVAANFNLVTLTERYVSFGPLLGTPAESAKAVSAFLAKAPDLFCTNQPVAHPEQLADR